MLYICTMCGGNISFNPGDRIGTCDSCGRQGTVPQDSDEQRLHQFNRANQYRQRSEFEKALANYERILDDNEDDAEAHWGAFLSRYGIEYVDENNDGKMKPTFHRMQMTSVLADADYLSAVKCAPDELTRKVYTTRANEIAAIQREIIEVSKSKEQQYDVFICYKEMDGENRTVDSVKAEEVYNYLTGKGYRVFFARRTLRLGVQFEPYIFAALQSARVMLVMGSKAEYFTSIWVKNEWSRYLDIIRKDNRGRALIPCFWNLDPYEDLPVEMSHLQAQDMNRVGALQDLYTGIAKIVDDGREKRKEPSKETGNRLDRELRNGETYLRLANYADAIELYREITKEYPDDYHGWWGCIVSQTRSFSEVFDEETQTRLDQWFGYVRSLSEKTDPNAFAAMRDAYGNYMAKVAVQDATKEQKRVADRITEIGSYITTCRKNIERTYNEMENINVSMRNRSAETERKKQESGFERQQIQKNLAQTWRTIARKRAANFFRIVWTVILLAVTLFFLCIILSALGVGNFMGIHSRLVGEDLIGLVVFAGIFFYFFGRMFFRSVRRIGSNSDYIGQLKDYTEELQNHYNKVKNREKQLKEDYIKYIEESKQKGISSNNYINYQNTRISRLNALASECQGYLNSQIGSAFYLYARCYSVGIDQPLAENVKQMHNRITYLLSADLEEGGQIG